MIDLSIITVNLNNKAGLIRTLQSVITQTYSNFEFIIIDGGSTDGSLQVILDNVDSIHYWSSAPDNGIYNAMNKGVQIAKGDYCLFLNSGDWLVEPTILQKVFAEKPQADLVSGNIYFYDNDKDKIKWHISSPEKVTAKTLFLGTLPHQATFIRRSLFEKIGLYKEHLKITSDWLFFVEALLEHHCSYQHYPGLIAYFSTDGISCDPKTELLPRQEQLSILRQRYPLFLPDYEYLDALEKQTQQWLGSREYKIYKFLERIGFIQLGIFCRRVKRTIERKVLHTVQK
jgi:glycosyltransferase involved in cell wall biosynthesis